MTSAERENRVYYLVYHPRYALFIWWHADWAELGARAHRAGWPSTHTPAGAARSYGGRSRGIGRPPPVQDPPERGPSDPNLDRAVWDVDTARLRRAGGGGSRRAGDGSREWLAGRASSRVGAMQDARQGPPKGSIAEGRSRGTHTRTPRRCQSHDGPMRRCGARRLFLFLRVRVFFLSGAPSPSLRGGG